MNLLYAILLAVIGLIAIVVELFVPAAGLIGLIGLGCIITGVSIGFIHYGTLVGMVFLIAVLILTPAIIILWFRHFPRSLVGKRLILFNPVVKAENPLESLRPLSPLIGKTGMVLTDLRPSGTILIENKKYSVVTAGEYIPKDKKVEITAVNGNRIEVREEV